MRIPCFFSLYVLLILWEPCIGEEDMAGAAVSTLPDEALKPSVNYEYVLTFVARFNTSTAGDTVQYRCGEYYASTFLGNLLHFQNVLDSECKHDGGGNSTSVTIGVKASVSLSKKQLNTTVNIAVSSDSRNGAEEARAAMIQCGEQLTTTLTNLYELEKSVASISLTMISGKRQADNCSEAHITEPGMLRTSTAWRCHMQNHSYLSVNQSCVKGSTVTPATPPPPPPPPPSTASTTDVTTKTYIQTTTDAVVFFSSTVDGSEIESTTTENGMHSTEALYGGSSTDMSSIASEDTSPASTEHASVDSSSVTADPIESTTAPSLVMTTPETPASTPPLVAWQLNVVNESLQRVDIYEGGLDVLIMLSVSVENVDVLCAAEGEEDSCHISITLDIDDVSNLRPPRCLSSNATMSQLVVHTISTAWQWKWPGHFIHDLDVATLREKAVMAAVSFQARIDGTYDGDHISHIRLGLEQSIGGEIKKSTYFEQFNFVVHDRDKKATCQSINDPHITTFDGLEYNNFYHGEFIMYREEDFAVHVFYQQCSSTVSASCNCAVTIRSADDVILIDRCRREKKPFNRLRGTAEDFSIFHVFLFLNGELTPGTHIFQETDGKKYTVLLPNGLSVKVQTNNELLNVWIMASPAQLYNTKGLCGYYDGKKENDLEKRSAEVVNVNDDVNEGDRPAPTDFILDWRISSSAESLMRGVSKYTKPYSPPLFCDPLTGDCSHDGHLRPCDRYLGDEMTEQLVKDAVILTEVEATNKRRRRRDTDNSVINALDPILYNKNFIPKKYVWKNPEENAVAKMFCEKYLVDGYPLGKLCSQVPGLNLQQEITTCTEDIKITGNRSWADSAREAMKEQCSEELVRNSSLPQDIVKRIRDALCPADCSGNGQCIEGKCQCSIAWLGADCSLSEQSPPYSAELPGYGLCDTRHMSCNTVMLYGHDFHRSPALTCHFQQCKVDETPNNLECVEVYSESSGLYINFNTVECTIPESGSSSTGVRQAYLISVSNDGKREHASDPLLFIPFDSSCQQCSTNTTSCQTVSRCHYHGDCYKEGEYQPDNKCNRCAMITGYLEWSKLCDSGWLFDMPDWLIAVLCALGGSIFGVLIGFFLYKCCCKRRKNQCGQIDSLDSTADDDADAPFDPLHRNLSIPTFSSDLRSHHHHHHHPHQGPHPPASLSLTYPYHNGRGVDNGIDSTTYF